MLGDCYAASPQVIPDRVWFPDPLPSRAHNFSLPCLNLCLELGTWPQVRAGQAVWKRTTASHPPVLAIAFMHLQVAFAQCTLQGLGLMRTSRSLSDVHQTSSLPQCSSPPFILLRDARLDIVLGLLCFGLSIRASGWNWGGDVGGRWQVSLTFLKGL